MKLLDDKAITIVGILGTTHNPDFRIKYHYPLSLLEELILEFHADVICGEVHPNAWDRYQRTQMYEEYLGTPASEYWDLVFPLCKQHEIEFIPIDWFETDVWFQLDYFQEFQEFQDDHRQRLELQEEEWDQRIRDTWNVSAIPFNSRQYDDLCKAKYEWLNQINPKAHAVRWISRNIIMAERVKNAVRQNPGKRILCIVGADHNYMMQELLRPGDWDLVYPLKR